jgi:hypothetical protein
MQLQNYRPPHRLHWVENGAGVLMWIRRYHDIPAPCTCAIATEVEQLMIGHKPLAGEERL